MRKIRLNRRFMKINKFIKNKHFMKHIDKNENNHYIVEGTTGKDVEDLQMMLLELSHVFPSIPVLTTVDGYYGDETKNVVKEFQSLNSLPTTGITDDMTWNKIKEFLDNKRGE